MFTEILSFKWNNSQSNCKGCWYGADRHVLFRVYKEIRVFDIFFQKFRVTSGGTVYPRPLAVDRKTV